MTKSPKKTKKEVVVQSNIDDLVPLENVENISVEENDVNNFDETHKEELKELQEETITLQKKKLDEIEQSVSKRNSKKSKIISIVLFIVNICVVIGILIYQLLKEDWVPLKNPKLGVGSFFMIVLLLGLVISCDTLIVAYLLKQSTGKSRWGLAYKVAEIGRYYDSVTPMATGGQPFQINYLKTHGMPIHTSLSIPLAKYVFGQISWVLISFISLIISWTDSSYGTLVSVTSLLGFIFASLILAATVFLSVCKTIGKKLVVRILKILYKMKIIKDYDKQYERIIKYISDFQDIMKQYARSPKDFIVMTFLSLAKLFLNYSLPFFIVRFFSPSLDGKMYIKLFVMTCLVDLSSSFFPLPGGTGLNEISFTASFGSVLANQSALLVWVLIFWRLCSYYIYLLQGVSILSYDMAYGNKKYKWQVKRENLVQESEVFKQEQINRFRIERAKRKNKTKKE